MNLYVVRHGEVLSNVKGIISGCNDEKLTEKGIIQASEVQSKLQDIKFDIVYCSPVERAKQTANIIVPKNDIVYDYRISERDPGTMLGKSRKNIDKNDWNSLDKDRTLEGAETLLSGLKRVRNFLDEVHVKYEDKNVLIVTHNFISKCVWILENNICSQEQINNFFHDNGEIKYYKTTENTIKAPKVLNKRV